MIDLNPKIIYVENADYDNRPITYSAVNGWREREKTKEIRFFFS